MWRALAEEQSQHFNRIFKFLGEDQAKMDSEVNNHRAKQERLRTRWTPDLDTIFADIVVEQIRRGNRSNDVFDKKTWSQIREEFNRRTNLSFNNNQLRKHLDVLRTRYHNLQSNQNDVIMRDHCFLGFDLLEDIGAPSQIEPAKAKVCPIYDQLCVIFADSGVDGKYAQSSHYGEVDEPACVHPSRPEDVNPHRPNTPSTSKSTDHNGSSPQKNISKNTAGNKRKRLSKAGSFSEQSSWNRELSGAMAGAISDMISSSNLRRSMNNPLVDDRFSISSCIKAMDEIEGVEDGLYYYALDLFENPSFREMFISLASDHIRLKWLKGKCGNYYPHM